MLKKRFSSDKKTCKVTFSIAHGPAKEAKKVALVGDFNDWDAMIHPMSRRKGGVFMKTLDLRCERSYQFRYLIDGSIWENDAQADDYQASPFGSDNSVVALP